MSWNHRILRRTFEGETFYAVHEVYYDENGNPNGCTDESVSPKGETMDELRSDILSFHDALTKPILNYEDFPG